MFGSVFDQLKEEVDQLNDERKCVVFDVYNEFTQARDLVNRHDALFHQSISPAGSYIFSFRGPAGVAELKFTHHPKAVNPMAANPVSDWFIYSRPISARAAEDWQVVLDEDGEEPITFTNLDTATKWLDQNKRSHLHYSFRGFVR